DLPQGLYDGATGREARAGQPIRTCSGQVPFCGKFARGTEENPCKLAASDRRVPESQGVGEHSARPGKVRNTTRSGRGQIRFGGDPVAITAENGGAYGRDWDRATARCNDSFWRSNRAEHDRAGSGERRGDQGGDAKVAGKSRSTTGRAAAIAVENQ